MEDLLRPPRPLNMTRRRMKKNPTKKKRMLK
jgi:hypothetical protein